MRQVILTMTTVPARIAGILPKTLRVLSRTGYEIHLNIPKVCVSTGEKYVVPDTLREIKNVQIFEDVQDFGPKTKIIPTLNRVTDPEAILITVDDDIIYNRDFVAYHINRREQYPDAALGFSGTRHGRLVQVPRADVEVDILDNYKSASYVRSMFNSDFVSKYAETSWNDDIVISAYFRDKGIKKIVLAYDKETFFVPRLRSFPLVTTLECPMTGCDVMRGHVHKTDSMTLQAEYDGIRG